MPNTKLLLSSSTLIVLFGHAAYANGAETETRPGALETIVVTAERRETDLQDTPISITALGAQQMERSGISNISDMNTFVPNLSISEDGQYGRANPQFNIRGVGSGVQTAGAVTERPVGLYIDGLYYARVQGSLLSVIDAERIEVLRGPQGTLFGRNTTGGAIVYTSKKPDNELAAQLRLKAGNFGAREVQGSVNVPLGDRLFLRATYANMQEDGYVQRGTIDLGNTDDEVARLQMRLEATPDITVDLSGTYSRTQSNGDPRVITDFNLYGAAASARTFGALDVLLQNQGEPRLADNDPRIVGGNYYAPAFCFLDDTDPFTFGSECETELDSELYVVTSNVAWKVTDAVTLKSITGYLEGDQQSNSDWVWSGAYLRPFTLDYYTFSQELQINFDTDKLNLVAGAIYFYENAKESEVTTEISLGVNGTNAANVLAGDSLTRRHEEYEAKTASKGAFAQATYNVFDKLDLTAGARYSWDSKDVQIDYIPTADDSRDISRRADESWSNFDWRLAAAYHPTDNIMVYASLTNAYKAGIADDSALESAVVGPDTTITFVPPEQAQSYEVGLRSELFDRRVRLNLSAFQTKYKDRQSIVVLAGAGVGGVDVRQTISLGDVDYEGVEGDVALVLVDGLMLTGSFGVVDYEIVENPDNVLANVAKSSYTLGALYETDIASKGTIATSLSYGWVGATWSDSDAIGQEAAGLRQARNPSYGLVNGRIEFTPDGGAWSVALYGKNLTDEVYSTASTAQSYHIGAGPRIVRGQYRGRPQSYGIEFKVNF